MWSVKVQVEARDAYRGRVGKESHETVGSQVSLASLASHESHESRESRGTHETVESYESHETVEFAFAALTSRWSTAETYYTQLSRCRSFACVLRSHLDISHRRVQFQAEWLFFGHNVRYCGARDKHLSHARAKCDATMCVIVWTRLQAADACRFAFRARTAAGDLVAQPVNEMLLHTEREIET